MAIGERIRYIRNLRGMTQKWLGMAIGFDEKTADIRVAQYESGTRSPKENYIDNLANVLDISPKALNLPEIDTYTGLAHTLFALEDIYGIRVGEIDGEVCLRLDKSKGNTYISMFDIFNAWHKELIRLKNDEITKDEYNDWRYNYPERDKSVIRAKVPSEELSNAIVKELKKEEKRKKKM